MTRHSELPEIESLAARIRRAMRTGQWREFQHLGRPQGKAAADIAAGIRWLLEELGARDEMLQEFRENAVQQHRQLLEEMSHHERDAQQLRHLADVDVLTGLPNRARFFETLDRAVANARRQRSELAVLVADVDRFKRIDASLGHDVGDEVLRIVAQRIESAIQPHGIAARWASDEFAILLPVLDSPADVDGMARRILAAISAPLTVDAYDLNITATIGIAVSGGSECARGESLVRYAMHALQQAKRFGTNRFEHFRSQPARAGLTSSPLLENRLRTALERREFRLHYQPILSLRPGRVSGVEALMRWEHPQLGTLPPACFINVAEETGLIVPLTMWALREACMQLSAWREEGIPVGRMSVNVSARHLSEPDLVDSLTAIAGEAGIDPSAIELEVTETVLVPDDRRSIDVLRLLKDRGFRIAIDDFGTGYSSLSYLQRLPVDVLKIDGTFVRNIGTDEDSGAIVAMIISVGHHLGLRLVAEGVETFEQLQFLREHGCDEIQGHLVSQAVPPWHVPETVRTTLATSVVADGEELWFT